MKIILLISIILLTGCNLLIDSPTREIKMTEDGCVEYTSENAYFRSKECKDPK